MNSLSKQRKCSEELSVKNGEDMITSLPTSLITTILSCLPTKDAVATSVLSTKWKRSWTSVTKLDFDDSKLTEYPHKVDNDTETFKKFTSFVTRVLLLCDRSGLQRIRMGCSREYDDSLVNAWLISVMQCNVQELDISIEMKDNGLLPSDVFICSTLVVLKLSVCGSYMNISNSARLPNLKTLHVHGVQFSNDVSITNLLSGCPVLEELSLCECASKDVHVVNIIAPVLKSLIIKYLPYNSWFQGCTVPNYQIKIDTPALEYFFFDNASFLPQDYFVMNTNHLIKAEIMFHHASLDRYRKVHSKGVENFIARISQVRKLILHWDSIEVIGMCSLALFKFSYLTYLELNLERESAWNVLPKLLKNSPSLKTLYLIQGNDIPKKYTLHNSPFDEVPSCFLFNLKKIKIESFEYSKGEMEVVEYILKNAKVLEKLTLYSDKSSHGYAKDAQEFLKALPSMPRASVTCKVVVVK